MGIIRDNAEYRFQLMGFDTNDSMLMIPLQAMWTAIEEIDRILTEQSRQRAEVKKILGFYLPNLQDPYSGEQNEQTGRMATQTRTAND